MEADKYYCQPDGGQWNVKVGVIHTLPAEFGDLVIITGEDLVSDVKTSRGWGIKVVETDTVFDGPLP